MADRTQEEIKVPHSVSNIDCFDMDSVDLSQEEQDDDVRKARDEAMQSAALVFEKQDKNGDGVMDLKEV